MAHCAHLERSLQRSAPTPCPSARTSLAPGRLPAPRSSVLARVVTIPRPPTSTVGDSDGDGGVLRSPKQQPVPVPLTEARPAPRLLTPQQQLSLARRHRNVARSFPTALGVDDFMARLEVALNGFGFTGENSIAMTNLCRDEVTTVLKDKIESVFGSSFNTNGLGAVLTCGLTGMGAGFSHSPISNGKEHYVFFAFPHIGINSAGEVGAITRPGRPVKSCACGALQKCLIELKAEGYTKHCKVPGVHDPRDPEYSILKQRLARRVRYEQLDPTQMDLVDMTHVAERTITNDLEYLIEKAVDTSKANYAVVTGVQIHNWATELDARTGVPSLEFVAPAKVFVMVDGVKYHIDLFRVPTMSPRQLQLMARASVSGQRDVDEVAIGQTVAGTLKEIPVQYLTQRLGVTRDDLDTEEALSSDDDEDGGMSLAVWQNTIIADMAGSDRDPNAPTMDSHDEQERFSSFRVAGFGGILPGPGNSTGASGGGGSAPVFWSPGI